MYNNLGVYRKGGVTMIEKSESLELEHIVRRVFNCDRFGVMGVADSDHLKRNPLDAALVIFAPLYKINKDIPELNEFMDMYQCIFGDGEDYQYNEQVVRSYIDELTVLVKKYWSV